MNVQLAGLVEESVVDGPGMRFVIFTQGCNHGCVGCHNPQTHDPAGGETVTVDWLEKQIDKQKLIRGITFSGGEPFLQSKAMAHLAHYAKTKNLHTLAYTGYTFEQLLAMSETEVGIADFLAQLDMLVDGPFVLEERDITLQFRGSKNQRILDVPKSLKKGKAVFWEDPNEAILKVLAPR
ncbi:MAG: anaerobic ribonucleoside-triphosphate reductase activating protein [Selenomonadales bacterium]|nr:anaerobic ribonucleoside-triphosphate reductase activating protein [Selenomonadales bacterium]